MEDEGKGAITQQINVFTQQISHFQGCTRGLAAFQKCFRRAGCVYATDAIQVVQCYFYMWLLSETVTAGKLLRDNKSM